MNYSIDTLLETKSFNDLNSSEQKFVLRQMSSEEYQKQYLLIQKTRASFSADKKRLTPHPSSLGTLQQELAKERGTSSIIGVIIQHKTPTWVTIAAGVLVFIFFQFSKISQLEQIDSNIIATTDTVFLEKEIIKYDTIQVEVKEPAQKLEIAKSPEKSKSSSSIIPETIITPTFYDDKMLNTGQMNTHFFVSNYQQTNGVPLAEDTLSQQINQLVN